jgi:RNA polymerase sigma-70 factor (ECF subfamily)
VSEYPRSPPLQLMTLPMKPSWLASATGDREALAALFRRYARIVRGVAYRVRRDPSEAYDLLQDTFLLVHRLCRTFDSSKAPAQFWLLQMTYRRAISRRRYLNARHFYAQVELDDRTVQIAGPGPGQLGASLDQRLAELDLQKVSGTLSEDQQRTLRLHFIEGYTLDEIAKMLGQTKGNIRHHSFRRLDGCENRFSVANCRAREQYDTGIVQSRSRGSVTKRTP